jgi:hypothetical protein
VAASEQQHQPIASGAQLASGAIELPGEAGAGVRARLLQALRQRRVATLARQRERQHAAIRHVRVHAALE